MNRITITAVTLALSLLILPDSAYAQQQRSQAAKDHFKAAHPCPANGTTRGSCPGFIIDHVKALDCGGADAPDNMQWQTVAEAKAKDKWERRGCSTTKANKSRAVTKAPGTGYYTGPKGGCYTYSASGKKRYVAHSFCR